LITTTTTFSADL